MIIANFLKSAQLNHNKNMDLFSILSAKPLNHQKNKRLTINRPCVLYFSPILATSDTKLAPYP